MSEIHTATMPNIAAPSRPLIGGGGWIAPALVGFALVSWLISVAVFMTHSLAELPRYFAHRYLVLDPTSLLFVLVINTVFLGISVYMLSRERSSPELTQDIRTRAALTLIFMLVLNIGVMANHLILLWALIEVSTACAALMMVCGEFGAPKPVAWRYMLYSSMTLAITFLGFMCLVQSAGLRGVEISFQVDQLGASLTTAKDGWQRCVLCGDCEPVCPSEKLSFNNDFKLASTDRDALTISAAYPDIDPIKVSEALHKRFGRSLKLRSVSAGGCNGCEMEINALSNVNFDLGRYGIDMVASPRHADGLVLSGPISRNMADALQIAWDAISEPKLVIAVGACAISGGIFAECNEVDRAFLDKFKPALYVPGCPTHPLSFISGILDLLGISD